MGEWTCGYCGARNLDALTRCRLCATVRPGVTFGSSPGAQAHPPTDALAEPISYAPPPPPLDGLPPPVSAPPPLGATPSPPGVDRGGLLVLLVVLALVVGAVGFFVVGTRTDPAAAKDREQATASLLTTADIGGQWRVVHEEKHALGGGTQTIIGGSSACSAPKAHALDLQAWAVRDFSVQQGAVVAYLGSAVVVASDEAEAAIMFEDFKLVAQACVTSLMSEAGAGITGFTISMHETDELSVGDHSATFTGALGVPGAGAAGIDTLVVQSGRSLILLIDLDTTGTIASKHFVDWAKAIGDRLKRNLPAR